MSMAENGPPVQTKYSPSAKVFVGGEQLVRITDDDFASKRMPSLLMIFFSLTETGGGVGSPVITVGAG